MKSEKNNILSKFWQVWASSRQVLTSLVKNDLYLAGAAAVRVPRVPGHPLNFDNGCQAPVLREILGAKRTNFFKNLEILLITSVTQLSFWENKSEPWKSFELGTRPLRGMEPPLIERSLRLAGPR